MGWPMSNMHLMEFVMGEREMSLRAVLLVEYIAECSRVLNYSAIHHGLRDNVNLLSAH